MITKTKSLTVKELRGFLEGVPDNAEVSVCVPNSKDTGNYIGDIINFDYDDVVAWLHLRRWD